MIHPSLGAAVLILAMITASVGIGAETGLVEPVAVAIDESGFEAQDTQIPEPSVEGVKAPARPDRSVILQCSPVAAYWTGTPKSEGMPPGPNLAIVSTEIRPKDARVHLDNRFVGRARYLDGSPGYLYLEPGVYLLEIHLGGYRSVLIELNATAGCRFDLKHRMERMSGSAKEKKGDPPGKGEPFHRVFGPVPKAGETASNARGPDAGLRRDLESGGDGAAPPSRGGSLRLRVSPGSARVSADGEFVATGFELQRMENALAMPVGRHRIDVSAPGYSDDSRNVDIEQGETVEIVIELSAENTINSD